MRGGAMIGERREGDSLWDGLVEEVRGMASAEPALAGYLYLNVLEHAGFEDALAFLLAGKLGAPHLPAVTLREIFQEGMRDDPGISLAARADLLAVRERDPAARGVAHPFLHYKGFHALQAYRVAHWLWGKKREALAYYLQNRISEVFAVDIHPAALIGEGILIDHGTSVVIGETAVVGDNVSLLHEVTLGGTGKETGDRHPKVASGVLIGAGAKVLGNVKIGEGSKIAASSVVLADVPPHTTVAGVPAKIVGRPSTLQPALAMDQGFALDFSI
ncbi:serine O-acetyltransferase [Geomonas sp. RF6]|uniref:serine O-acetyltransferase n=1 Tax=Geomonas sp. RF6 TaxID=2897342 RepID=UPI001E390CFF|nr:serine O-acetyltransferase [Geomonas sp. RF6]UFS70077.1 serine O-acetyltransferase [Geomonas sp. RF6]